MDASERPEPGRQPPDPAGPGAAERTEFEERLGTRPQKPGLLHRIASVWKDEYDTAMNWPRGKRHLLMRGLAVLVANTIALLIVAYFMDSINFTGTLAQNVFAAAAVTIVAGVITFVLRPVVFVALGINNVIVTGVLTVIFMGLTLLVASWVVERCRGLRLPLRLRRVDLHRRHQHRASWASSGSTRMNRSSATR